jgi:NAD+ synthase
MSVASVPFTRDVLRLDAAAETARIAAALREQVGRNLRRKGVVVGLSGGVDSSVCAALCVRAFGAKNVLGLFMPERESSPDSLRLGRELADSLGIATELEDIADALAGVGCYRRRDEALRSVLPEFGPGYRFKIVLPNLKDGAAFRLSSAVFESPSGEQTRVRLPLEAYQQIVAATNFKQRIRKMMEYYHADRLRYAVVGTPNLLEYDQGFFVKQGDGAADVKPIAHLYKTQVYQLAEHLNVVEEIRRRPPTTDTFSLEQTQEEFYFSLPYDQMDLCLYGKIHDVPVDEVAAALNLPSDVIAAAYRDVDAKRAVARYLHARPMLIDETDR